MKHKGPTKEELAKEDQKLAEAVMTGQASWPRCGEMDQDPNFHLLRGWTSSFSPEAKDDVLRR